MPIAASTLYRDTAHFMRNQIINILLLCFLTAMLAFAISKFSSSFFAVLQPENIQLVLSQVANNPNVPPESISLLMQILFLALAINLPTIVMLVASVICLAQQRSSGQKTHAIQALKASLPAFPILLLFFIIYSLLIFTGIMLLVIPGVIVAIILSLTPVILLVEKANVFSAIAQSAKIVFSHFTLIFPVIILWFGVKYLIEYLTLTSGFINSEFGGIIIAVLSNTATAFIFIYFFRFYTLLKNKY